MSLTMHYKTARLESGAVEGRTMSGRVDETSCHGWCRQNEASPMTRQKKSDPALDFSHISTTNGRQLSTWQRT